MTQFSKGPTPLFNKEGGGEVQLCYVLMYFLDTYINMVKYLQRVPLDVSIHKRYLRQDAGKTYSEISNKRSYWGI